MSNVGFGCFLHFLRTFRSVFFHQYFFSRANRPICYLKTSKNLLKVSRKLKFIKDFSLALSRVSSTESRNYN